MDVHVPLREHCAVGARVNWRRCSAQDLSLSLVLAQLDLIQSLNSIAAAPTPSQTRFPGSRPVPSDLAQYQHAFVLRCGGLWLVRRRLEGS